MSEFKPKISLCMTMRGREWLLPRALHWLLKQDYDPDLWELIVIDDCSPEPIFPLIQPLVAAGRHVQFYRLEHADGWRGITAGMLYAFEHARAPIVAETNNHLLLRPQTVRLLAEAHADDRVRQQYCRSAAVEDEIERQPSKVWVSARPFNLTTEGTEHLNETPWDSDLNALWDFHWSQNPWSHLWGPGGPNEHQRFGTHLICSIPYRTFCAIDPWPSGGFKDYGTDDPAYAGARGRHKVIDLNLWGLDTMVAHLAHNNHAEDALELWPTRLNRHGHTAATARLWEKPEERDDKPTLQDVIDYWTRGQRTTDWRVRTAWGYPCPPPDYYIETARAALAAGKTRVEELA